MRDIKDFGAALLMWLEAEDLSARKLATRCGLSISTIHSYINEGIVPRPSSLHKMDSVLHGIEAAWGDAVAEYHRQTVAKRAQTRRANGEGVHFAAAAVVDKPWKGKTHHGPSRYGPVGTLAEVCRAARKAGLSYGQYVAAHSVEGR